MWLLEIIGDMLSMLGLTGLFSLGIIGWILIGVICIISIITMVVFTWFVASLLWAWGKRLYWVIARKDEPYECEMIGWRWIEKMFY